MRGEDGQAVATSLVFSALGVWLLWGWLDEPDDTLPFWLALAAAVVVAALTVVVSARGRAVPAPQHTRALLVLVVGATGFTVVSWAGVPAVVTGCLVVASLGVFLGWGDVDVWHLWRRRGDTDRSPVAGSIDPTAGF